MKQTYTLIKLTFLLFLTIPLTHANTITVSTNGIKYINSGIGEEEVNALKKTKNDFNLHLIFSAGESGEAITNVDVNIYDSQNQLVFKLNNALPRLNINLPSNAYAVVAHYQGQKQSHLFTLNETNAKKIILNWKDLGSENVAE
jgi:hypothetical protein